MSSKDYIKTLIKDIVGVLNKDISPDAIKVSDDHIPTKQDMIDILNGKILYWFSASSGDFAVNLFNGIFYGNLKNDINGQTVASKLYNTSWTCLDCTCIDDCLDYGIYSCICHLDNHIQ